MSSDKRYPNALKIIEELKRNGYKAYFCGGCVRDFILKRTPKDYDIVTDAHTDKIQSIFKHTVPVGAKFGIIKVMCESEGFDVATFRKDGHYEDARRPQSIEFCSEREDTLRRDFTVNGLFFDPVKNVVMDYVGGQEDIRKKLIRTIGFPHDRFSEDHLRLMRAIRFAAQLDFEIEDETWRALSQMAPLIQTVSSERIRQELESMLLGPNPARAISLFYESGLLPSLFPGFFVKKKEEGKYDLTHLLKMLNIAKPIATLELGLGILFFSLIGQNKNNAQESPWQQEEHWKKIGKRLCLSRKTMDSLLLFQKYYSLFSQIQSLSQSDLKRFFALLDFFQLLELYRLDSIASQRDMIGYIYCQKKMQEFGPDQIKPHPLVHGDDLKRLGFSPGPIFKKIITFIEDLQLEGKISTQEEALQWIQLHFGEGKNIAN